MQENGSGTTPTYSLMSRRRFGIHRHAKLHRLDVVEMRRWARREGYGLSLVDQARVLRERYGPTMSLRAFEDVLSNRAWFDPAFDREQPDPEWAELPVPVALLILMRQSARVVEVFEQSGLPQRPEGVLDGAPVQAGEICEAAGRAYITALECGVDAPCS